MIPKRFQRGLAIAAVLVLAACGGNNTSKNNVNGGTNSGTNNNTNSGTNNDECVNVQCGDDTPMCDGNTLVEYEDDASECCPVEVRTDCTATGQDCMAGACVDVDDLCGNVDCTQPADFCENDTAVTYSGDGVCDDTDGMCDYSAVESTEDCTANDQICMNGACVDDNNLCENVDCTQPDDYCDVNNAVTYSGDGTCDMTDGTCDYSNVETITDCTATSQICVAGACVADDNPDVGVGDLVITEFMKNPDAVGDNAGEWVEIFNPTNRTLDLQGLKLVDDGTDEFIFPTGNAINLAGRSYFVLGKDTDDATNGGLTVDLAYGTDYGLANGDDEIVILDENDVEIDRVNYNDNDFPDSAGISAQFGSEFSFTTDDNNDGAFWCNSYSPYGDGDSGTPGAANTECTPADFTVQELSDESDANHPPVGRPVNVAGLAISAIDTAEGYIFAQDPAGGEYSGLYIDAGAVDVSTLVRGDIIDVTGSYVEEFDGLVSVIASDVTDTGNDMTVSPELVDTSVLADPVTADPWEGVLLQIVEAGVTEPADNFGEVTVDNNILVDDLLYDVFSNDAAACDVYATITAPLNYSFGNHKLEPRDANDIGAVTAATATTDVAPVNTTGFDPKYICVAAGATVTWTNSDAVGHTVTERLPTEDSANNANIPTTPAFDETLGANDTATITFADPGTNHYRCRPHAAMEGAVVVTPN